jgi:integrase/recombinase XerD
MRHVPAQFGNLELLNDYLKDAGHGSDPSAPLFRPVRNNRTGRLNQALAANAVSASRCRSRSKMGISGEQPGLHAQRATAATNALDHRARIANSSGTPTTTKLYDTARGLRIVTLKVSYRATRSLGSALQNAMSF